MKNEPFKISKRPINPSKLRRELADDVSGACATFEGWVRQRNDGRPVKGLEYEAYTLLAEDEGRLIVAEAKKRFKIRSARCVHRVGRLAVGDLAVWVAVTAEHRDAAFAACRYIIDEAKSRVPIWKKEQYRRGASAWINQGKSAP